MDQKRTALCVRYEGNWRRIHQARELIPALRELQSKQRDGGFPDFTAGSFRPRRDEKLPFIMLWEPPLGICR